MGIEITPPHKKSKNQSGCKYLKWVDTAKAIGVYLVVWGHLLPTGSYVARIIYSFHMPMFFILSGYVINEDDNSLSEYMLVKYHRLMKPTLILYLSTLPIYFLLMNYSETDLLSIIDRIFYLSGKCAYNVPVWFFFCMFEILAISKFIGFANASLPKLLFIGVSCIIITLISYHYRSRTFSLFGMNKCFMALLFLTIGQLLRKLRQNFNGVSSLYLFCGVMAFPIWLYSGLFVNEKVSMYSYELGNMWLFILSGIFGSIVFFVVCKVLERISLIREYARWTIFIVCTHFLMVTFYNFEIKKYIIDSPYFIFLSAVLALLVMIAYRPICFWVERHVPILLGSK